MHDYTDLVSYIIKAMVSKPEDVKVAMIEGERTNRVEVTLANDDVGKVIGRGGRHIDAIRAVGRAAALKNHDRVLVEIVGPSSRNPIFGSAGCSRLTASKARCASSSSPTFPIASPPAARSTSGDGG